MVIPERILDEVIRSTHQKDYIGVTYNEKHVDDNYYIQKLKADWENNT